MTQVAIPNAATHAGQAQQSLGSLAVQTPGASHAPYLSFTGANESSCLGNL